MNTIQGLIWHDLDSNGIFSTGDTYLEDITVNLYDAKNLQIPFRSTTTSNVGLYLFDNLPASKYFVEVIPSVGFKFTYNNVGVDPNLYSSINPYSGLSPIVKCLNNSTVDINVGLLTDEKYSISGLTFFDCINNGLFTPNDGLVNSVSIYLQDEFGNEIAMTTSSTINKIDGSFKFENLEAGNYILHFTKPSGLEFTVQNLNPNGSLVDPTTGNITFTINNQNLNNLYAGFTGNYSIKFKYCMKDISSQCNNCLSCGQC